MKSRSPVTFKCLYNTASLSSFTFSPSSGDDVSCLSVKLGVVNIVVSFTLLVFGVKSA